MSSRRVAFARSFRSICIFACLASVTPSFVQALDLRSDPLASDRSWQSGYTAPNAQDSERVEFRASAHWKHEAASAVLGDMIATVLDTPRDDANFIDNPEPNAGVLLGLGLLGLTARRYRNA